MKPEPDREIPQAQSAHDTFWDFASLTPESTHMLMWVMSDRGIPRSYRTMEGFGVHAFRLSDETGATTLVKFHWKPVAGIHSLVWYLDTQLTRLGGPNFDQLPINRPRSPVNSNHRDGFGQQAIHDGVAPYFPNYFPNSLGSGCPFHAGDAGFRHVPRPVAGTVVRERPQSFDDHFTQATMFWNSMTAPERDHIVAAFSFELGKCVHPEVRERTLANLADVDDELCGRVAENLGMDVPAGTPATDAGASAALSQVPAEPGPIDGRVVGVLVGPGVDGAGVEALRDALGAGANLYVIAPTGGTVPGAAGPVPVDRTVLTTQSVEYDALVVAGGDSAAALAADPYTAVNLGEAFRHHKVLAAWGEGEDVLAACGITAELPGIVVAEASDADFASQLVESMGWHRHWDSLPV